MVEVSSQLGVGICSGFGGVAEAHPDWAKWASVTDAHPREVVLGRVYHGVGRAEQTWVDHVLQARVGYVLGLCFQVVEVSVFCRPLLDLVALKSQYPVLAREPFEGPDKVPFQDLKRCLQRFEHGPGDEVHLEAYLERTEFVCLG